jgi:predicted Zn finger-like uncharacterized protein
MLIACPNCTTSYLLPDVAIGANGRSVRCARCQHQWRAEPATIPSSSLAPTDAEAAFQAEPASLPRADPAADLAPDKAPAETPIEAERPTPVDLDAARDETLPLALSDIPIPIEQVPLVPAAYADSQVTTEMDNGPPDVESVAARRDSARLRKRRSRRRFLQPAAIIALLAICASLLEFRKDIVRHVPQLASFYSAIRLPVNLRGLAFADLKIGNETHDGVPVLIVEGTIVSVVSHPTDVPRLRFALRSATGAEVYSWTAPPSQAVLGAFETLPFRTRLASPPAEGHDVQVRFFTRRDAVAGLH